MTVRQVYTKVPPKIGVIAVIAWTMVGVLLGIGNVALWADGALSIQGNVVRHAQAVGVSASINAVWFILGWMGVMHWRRDLDKAAGLRVVHLPNETRIHYGWTPIESTVLFIAVVGIAATFSSRLIWGTSVTTSEASVLVIGCALLLLAHYVYRLFQDLRGTSALVVDLERKVFVLPALLFFRKRRTLLIGDVRGLELRIVWSQYGSREYQRFGLLFLTDHADDGEVQLAYPTNQAAYPLAVGKAIRRILNESFGSTLPLIEGDSLSLQTYQ